MATNGNSALQPSDPLESLERTLRGVAPAVPVQAEAATETYDAMMRGRDTVQMLRDMARYNNEVADAIERTMAAWHGHSNRLMGKAGT
jgi:hypothetical protein